MKKRFVLCAVFLILSGSDGCHVLFLQLFIRIVQKNKSISLIVMVRSFL